MTPVANAVLFITEQDMKGLALFQRAGRYYVLMGSCCCQCTWGSSPIVYGPRIQGAHGYGMTTSIR